MQQLPYYNCFFQTARPPGIELSTALCGISPPQFNRAFFTGSGSEANDTVIKLVRRYWDLLGKADKMGIISRKNAYHGSTVAASTRSGMDGMQKQTGGLLPGIEHLEHTDYI